MALTIDEVRRIAILARLRLSPEEEVTFRDQLGDIVDYIDQLRGYPALAEDAAESPVAEADDRPGECLPWPAVEGNAPETLDRFLVVPQVKAGDD